MSGPHGREFLNSAMKERMRHAANQGEDARTEEGRARVPGAGRMTPPIRTVDKEWGGIVGTKLTC